MDNILTRPLPTDLITVEVSELTRPFWEAARKHQLTAQACSACGHFRMPPTPVCPRCRSKQHHWPILSGEGRLYSFTLSHALAGAAKGETYLTAPALVELPDAENVRLFAAVIDAAESDLRIGMRLTVKWVRSREGWLAPAFAPA